MSPLKLRSSQSFGPEKRLRKRWQFRAFAGKSRAIRLADLTVYFLPNKEGHFRLGVTVRARTDSVRRNRVKRIIRDFFRLHAGAFGSFDFNVVISPGRDLRHPFDSHLKAALKDEFLPKWVKTK